MKKIIIVIFSILFLVFFTKDIYSSAEFITSAEVTYEVGEEGLTKITHNIILENRYANLYATSYTLLLEGMEIKNPKAYQGSNELSLEKKLIENENLSLKIVFPDSVIGKGNQRHFRIVFDDESVVERTGEVWEVFIPKLASTQSFDNYIVKLIIPKSFGNIAYISPQPFEQNSIGEKYLFAFAKSDLLDGGVSAAFGRFQVFSFDITYHLENPLNREAFVEIAIPPDTAFQRVIYENITPEPKTVRVDRDGNWLAVYTLNPRERMDVKALGTVEIFSEKQYEQELSDEQRNKYLEENDVWQKNEPKIIELAEKLKTPKAIYDYVTKTLSYDYEKVRPNVQRLGALAALDNPQNAICMEYTDLFIAISRAAGIPAREVNGFAYTENPEIQPLSLVADVLHSWPEYWDEYRKVWVPIDPTWGSTTGGVDYFSKLDLRHFTFVIHASDFQKPYPPGSYKLGSNPQKDVFISFSQIPEKKITTPQVSTEILKSIPFRQKVLKVKIKNPGPTALYKERLLIYFDSEPKEEITVDMLVPYEIREYQITIPYGIFSKSPPRNVIISFNNVQIPIKIDHFSAIVSGIVIIFLSLLVLTFLVLIYINKDGKIKSLMKIKNEINKIYKRKIKKLT